MESKRVLNNLFYLRNVFIKFIFGPANALCGRFLLFALVVSSGILTLSAEGINNNRIGDYTAKIFNSTTTVTMAQYELKLFLPNLQRSSFIFYADESGSNLINHEDILQRHFIYKISRNHLNISKTQIKSKNIYKKQQQHLSEEVLVFDDDYLTEYDDEKLTMNKFKSSENATPGSSTGCSSCHQNHEKAKRENLESIKKHILMRLQLSQPPKITLPSPVIPQKILDYFYKNFNYSRTMTSPPQTVYKQRFKNNNKINKRKTKVDSTNIEDKLRDYRTRTIREGNSPNDDDGEIADDDEDMMISDNRYDYFDGEDLATSIMQTDEFYSRLHSIYVFPTKTRLHHNRKPEIFNFKFNSDPSRISSTILHVFIKGQNWIYEYEPDLLEKKNMELSMKKKQEILIIIYRALRRPNSSNYTHTVKLIESRQKIPPGKGQWVEIEIKELSTYWMKTPNSTQSIIIRGMESWMRTFIVTEDQSNDKSLTMHIEIVTKVKKRFKRSAALDCRESDNEVRCCRYPLTVNFTNFGWNFIVAPQQFDAYFCNGECNVGYLETYPHTHITSLTTSPKPCCSPQKLNPLALLYFDNNNKLMYSTIPSMSVEKCSCS